MTVPGRNLAANSEIRIGDRVIGPGHPCFVIAEAGINHNGDIGLAKRIITAAAEAGADAVKFQNYRTEDFVADPSLTYEYLSEGRTVVESQIEMFKRCELGVSDLRDLKDSCDEAGVAFLSTPTGDQGVRDLVGIGAAAIKNGSDYLGNLPLLQTMAATGLPVIISTGMATLDEVEDAVNAFREARGRELAILHCVSAYPAPLPELNLRKMDVLSQAFGCPVGFSDHSEGVLAATVATAMGASIVEKHFTLDRTLPGPDHRFSADPEGLSELVRQIRATESCLGDGTFLPAESEREGRKEYRLSCQAAKALNAGHVLAEHDIVFRRPGTAFEPKKRGELVGRRLTRDVAPGHIFTEADLG